MKLSSLATAFCFLLAAEAAPSDLEKRSSCTISGTSISNLSTVKSSCTEIIVSGLTVPAGETLDLTGLKSGTTVTFEGTTTFGYKEWEGPLISVSGTDITVTGASGHVINGNGAKWWDGKGSNGGKTKPKFFYAHKMYSSTISGLNIKNTPVQGFSINTSKSLTVSSVTIDNTAGDVTNGGHNTDAFDIGSSDSITITGAKVYNQDDCLAINSGTNIIFTKGYCSGGHGLSIGSVGGRSNNVVKGVTISDSTVTNSDNGVRIKTVYGATGSVSGVTYSGITLSKIAKYGVVIEGDYENGSPTGTPTSGVPITDLTLKNIKGTVDSSATNVYILVKGASDWTWSGVSVTGGKTSSKCTGIPSGSGASC